MPDPVAVRQLIPTFHVRDVEKAADWYRDKMGWEVQFVGAPDYAAVKIGGQVLHLAQWQKAGAMPPCQAYVLLAGGVDDYAARLAGRGVKPYHGPVDQPYGLREFNVRDLDGNYLHIGQSIAPR
ncbi:MAG: VOC family protein [Planctomycetes bacterium]|nr:VOC family protein [Planctomycetota bacterium]